MNNKDAAILVLAASLAGASLLVIGDACDGVPSVPVDAACRTASTGPAMYDLCMRTLSSSSPSNNSTEATTYAAAAAAAAMQSCSSTADAGKRMLWDGSLRGDLWSACRACMHYDYGNARNLIAGAGDQLDHCTFARLSQTYMYAIDSLESCATRLVYTAGGMSTPLYSMVVGDRDKAVLAFRLAGFLMP